MQLVLRSLTAPSRFFFGCWSLMFGPGALVSVRVGPGRVWRPSCKPDGVVLHSHAHGCRDLEDRHLMHKAPEHTHRHFDGDFVSQHRTAAGANRVFLAPFPPAANGRRPAAEHQLGSCLGRFPRRNRVKRKEPGGRAKRGQEGRDKKGKTRNQKNRRGKQGTLDRNFFFCFFFEAEEKKGLFLVPFCFFFLSEVLWQEGKEEA